ncbi:ATP-dependent helicase [soil metagenome]
MTDAALTSHVPFKAPDPFAVLNDEQRSAVDFDVGVMQANGAPAVTSGPLLVIAGAGSGKTLTLASRVARLVLAGADPQRILLLTFSRRAAQEMQRRAGRVLHQALGMGATQQPPGFSWAGTFHAIGARLLREYAARIGLSDAFTIHDRPDSEDLMGLVRHDLGYSQTEHRFPQKGTCTSIYSRVVNSRASLHDVLAAHFPWCAAWEDELKNLFRHYAAEKHRQQVLDYDDLLLYWCEMMADAEMAAEVGARFDHVLVDEYQDTNRLQAAILQSMKPSGRGLTVVGDDAQSIYSFRAAEVRNILEFPHAFGNAGTVVTLDRNYRSTQPILEASNAVIGLSSERFAKRLWTDSVSSQKPQLVTVEDESQQARWVADQLLARRESGLTLKSQAVLFRTATHSAPLELELARRNIPFVKFGGLKFLEAAHVKDLLSVLRWAENPRGRMAGFRVAQLVAGIGAASARRLMDVIAEAPDTVAAMRAFKPPSAASKEWKVFVDVYERLHAGSTPSASAASEFSTTWPADLELAIRWYVPQLERIHEDAQVRQADLQQLARVATNYSSRERFLTELTLDPPEATSDESGVPSRDEDYVILSTIHSAKGQEWNSVFVLNVVDGCIPSDMSTGVAEQIEEERRLLYVAMTRARHHLQLIVPQRFYVTQQSAYGDRHLYGSLTRFIPRAVEHHFEATGCKLPADVGGPVATPRPGPKIDVSNRLQSRWS